MRKGSRRTDWRSRLAVWLVGLMLALSGAPCVGVAAPVRPAVSRPADPCQPTRTAPVAPCAQAACQVAAQPPPYVGLNPPAVQRVALVLQGDLQDGRYEPPPDPPPRASMS